MDRIVEEFRRYKVRSEIARKQKDSEQKHSSNSSPAPPSGAAAGTGSGSVSVEQAMSEGTLGYFSSSSSTRDSGGLSAEGVQARIDKETNRWKVAYESVVKENEQLRHRGKLMHTEAGCECRIFRSIFHSLCDCPNRK